MNELERYLRRATAGLPRRERAGVREELRGSVLERAAEHQLAGLRAEQALAAALREFGDPRPLAAGMRRVHLWPRVSAWTALCSAAMVAGWLAVAPSAAQQVTITTQGLKPVCTEQGSPPPGASYCTNQKQFWVSLGSLQEQLARQGVTWEVVPQIIRVGPVTAGAGGERQTVEERQLRFAWPQPGGKIGQASLFITDERAKFYGGGRRVAVDGVMTKAAYDALEDGAAQLFASDYVFTRGQDTFLQGNPVIGQLASSANVPVVLERPLDGPVLHVGRVKLQLGQPGQGAQGESALRQAVEQWLWEHPGITVFSGGTLMPRPDEVRPSTPLSRNGQRVKVQGQPGELYAVLRPVTSQGVNGLSLDLVAADAQGQLRFRTAQAQVRYTLDWPALARSGERKAAVTLLRLGRSVRLDRAAPQPFMPELPRH